MKRKLFLCLILFMVSFLLMHCSKDPYKSLNRIVIGIPSDLTTFNPLFTFNVNEGNITELIYLGLIGHGWDEDSGELTSFPLLAEDWEWSEDSLSIIFNLRKDVFWSDSIKFTAEDIIFSFDLYSDVLVQSRFYGIFEDYYTEPDLSINLVKSFEIINPYRIRFNFKPGSSPDLFDVDMPLIPKHIFGNIPREELATCEENFKPIGTGPYVLSAWNKNQSIILRLNKASFLSDENSIEELIFKVVPDYNARKLQLKNREIDLLEYIKPEDVSDLSKADFLKVAFRKGRDYDYIGWNNIDPERFEKNEELLPHKLFGSKKVRIALTHAINRELILEEFYNDYGEIAETPVAPIFKWAVNSDLKPYRYNPGIARKMLEEEGWIDFDNDGIRERNGIKFSFTIDIAGGNPGRNYAATVIQNDLKTVGIEVNIETLEPSVFVNKLFQRKLDAWVSGWVVPIPMYLKPYWHSDLINNIANTSGYISERADMLLEKLDKKISRKEMIEIYKEFQAVISEDQPVTFLYWLDNVVVYNSKIQKTDINPLGAVHYCWNWILNE